MLEPSRNNYCTIRQAAEILSVSPSTVWRWIEVGLLPAYRFGRRQIWIERGTLGTVIQPARPIAQARTRQAMAEQLQKIRGTAVLMSTDAPADQNAVVRELSTFQTRLLAERRGKRLPGSSADLIRAARLQRSAI